MIARPDASEYAPFFAGYVSRVPDGDVLDLLARQVDETASLLGGLSETRAGYRYAPGKWSVKEVVGHVADAERVFTYRALRIARGDQTPLASFDENAWMRFGSFDTRPLADLLAELRTVRQSSLALYRSFTPEAVLRRGTASQEGVSVRALIHITAGHERHHVQVLRERYLKTAGSGL
jgi:hypothetical protein